MTKRPVGRPRKFAGPKMASGKFKSKGGLNKTEKKQTKKIAEAVVKKEHSLKSFNVAIDDNANAPRVSVNPLALKQVSVIGYSSTLNTLADASVIKYGPQNLIEMKLARPHQWHLETDVDYNSDLNPMSMNGQYVIPKVARTNFSVERVAYVVHNGTGTGVNTPDPLAGFSLPITCRMLKIQYKNVSGTNVIQNINVDLFVDQFLNPFGIDSPTSEAHGGFDRLDCQYAKVNKKLYKVLEDKQFTIQQNNILTPNQGSGGNTETEIFTQKSGMSNKDITMNYQLSARKGGKLFYEGGKQQATNNPTSGVQRTLTLFHFFYRNGHTLLGATNQCLAPGSINVAGDAAHAQPDIQIKTRSMASFVDAQ